MAESVALSPDQTALVVSGKRFSYQAIHSRALGLAGRICSAVPQLQRRSARVALLCGRGVDAYVGILSILYAGGCVVPLLADFPAARTKRMLEDLAADLVVLDEHGAAVWPQLKRGEPTLLTTDKLDDGPALVEPRWNRWDDPAYVLFTSGSTGRPKGVILTHGNLLTYFGLTDKWYSWNSQDVFSQAANLNWDASVSDVWSAWGAGGTLVPVPPTAYRDLPSFIVEQKISVWFSAPSVIALVRRCGKLIAGSMPCLTHAIFGGEPLRCSDMVAWQDAAPHSQVFNVYGPTETTIVTHRHLYQPGVTDALAVNGIAPLGRVHPGTVELLVNEDGSQALTEGELWLGGDQISAGYVVKSVDSERYLERNNIRWYRTGDLVRRLCNGELAYLGRIDNQVQVHGVRVEIAEIEQALETQKQVDAAVVVPVPDEETVALMVWYTAEEDVSPIAFSQHLREQLPDAIIPRRYQRLNELPLNSNRKIDRKLLQQWACEASKSRKTTLGDLSTN